VINHSRWARADEHNSDLPIRADSGWKAGTDQHVGRSAHELSSVLSTTLVIYNSCDYLACSIPSLASIFANFKLQAAAAAEHGGHEGRGIVGVPYLRVLVRGHGEAICRVKNLHLVLCRCLVADTILIALLMVGEFTHESQAADL
jgi:hypothetical protein